MFETKKDRAFKNRAVNLVLDAILDIETEPQESYLIKHYMEDIHDFIVRKAIEEKVL